MTRRGGDARGSAADRRRRHAWLVETFRADVDLLVAVTHPDEIPLPVERGTGVPCAPCYRCDALLTVETVTADRIIPGCEGGTYRRDNIRPACGPCQWETGGILGAARAALARVGRHLAAAS